jgi:hypothetical protein
MSSTRRSANEINILAMLDRHETGGLPRRLLRGLRGRSAMWYGAAGMLVVGLVGALGWLAHDSGAPSADDTALAGTVAPVAAQASGGTVRSTPPAAVSLPRLEAAPATAPVAPPETDAAVGVAPTLASAPAAGATIVEMAPAPLPEPAVPAPRNTQPATQVATQHAAQHSTQRLAAHTPAAKPAARTASPKAPAAANRAPALAHAEPRARRTPASAKPAPAAVDTDVALISAIIQHANKRQENEEAARKP